jgi:hypothetical protein
MRIFSSTVHTKFMIKKYNTIKLTWYSHLNSCSRKLRRRSSQDNSNAVKIGSLLDNAINEGLANAR